MSVNFFQIFLFIFYLYVISDAIVYAIKNRIGCSEDICKMTRGLHDARFVSCLFSIMIGLFFLVANVWTFVSREGIPTDLDFFWYFFDLLVAIYIWSNHHRLSIIEKRSRKS